MERRRGVSALSRCSPQGPYLDLSPFFPPGVFAAFTLRGFSSVSPEGLAAFLGGLGHGGAAVHRVEQVHSARVVEASQAPCEADAIVSREPLHFVRVVTADCVPVLLASGDGAEVAAVHAGWKGTLARIVEAAVRRFRSPGGLTAWIGPSVGPCCYAVDGERYGAFRREFPRWVAEAGPRPALDLAALNARMLEEAGLPPERIHRDGRCTACHPLLFCSYRRDGDEAGRMAALIGRLR
ncbi:MAG: peptidoglycan editing factor PgeF [Acidobacteriota bacterium]